MRRSYFTIFLAVGLGVMLLLLGSLQYRWQSEISENEAQRLHKLAQENARRFAEDFNKEIQNAYFNFQVEAEDWRAGNYGAFLERYDFWRGKTVYPDLIRDFYFFDADGKNAPLRFDMATRTFVPAEWTPELHDIFARTRTEKSFQAVNDDIYTLILPQNEAPPRVERIMVRRTPAVVELRDKGSEIPPPGNMPKAYGYLAIRLDQNVIKTRLLPDIAAKNFGDGDYRVKVTGHNGETIFQTSGFSGDVDAAEGLFRLSPDDIFFFSNRDLATAIAEKKENVVLSRTHVESRTLSRTRATNDSQGTINVKIENGDRPKTEIFTTTQSSEPAPHWTLGVQHSAGSIDAYVAGVKTRNLAVGYGILGLLAFSAGAIIYSTQRAKAFAQRQIDFVSSVSHEFRTPLAVIYSAGENLADGVANDPEQTSRYGELIKGEGRKLSAMVEQILEFAGANSGKRKLNFRLISVSEVVDGAVDACRPLLDEQQIELQTDVDISLPPINADMEALSRAIQNLITNSVKYRNGSNWILVTAKNGGDHVSISVEDRGIGISKDELGKIFQPFYRARDVVDAQIHGNGLGLSIVKQVVEAHGGSVTAESELDVGSKFTIELPVSENA